MRNDLKTLRMNELASPNSTQGCLSWRGLFHHYLSEIQISSSPLFIARESFHYNIRFVLYLE